MKTYNKLFITNSLKMGLDSSGNVFIRIEEGNNITDVIIQSEETANELIFYLENYLNEIRPSTTYH